jgi:hypothetical protein
VPNASERPDRTTGSALLRRVRMDTIQILETMSLFHRSVQAALFLPTRS